MQLPGDFSSFIEKKWFFAKWSGGLPLPTPLVVRPLKKTLFLCVSSLTGNVFIFKNMFFFVIHKKNQRHSKWAILEKHRRKEMVNNIWQTTPAPECNPVFQVVTRKICNLVLLKFNSPRNICWTRCKLWHPMSKKVQHGISGATIYHWVTQFYHQVPQFFIGLCRRGLSYTEKYDLANREIILVNKCQRNLFSFDRMS